MRTPRRLVVCGLAGLAIAVFYTFDSNAQVQLPTVSHPIKSIGSIAITRDGRQVVFGGSDTKGQSGTWLKDVRTGTVTRLDISDEPSRLRFSPDGQWLLFLSGRDSALRRVRVSGGASIRIGDASFVESMDWGDDNRIVFSQPRRLPDAAFKYARNVSVSQLRRVPVTGGQSELVAEYKENEHLVDIHVLPGSRAALVTMSNYRTAWIVAQPLDGGASRVVVPSGSHARYVRSKGVIVYRMATPSSEPIPAPLAAAPFDPKTLRLTGAAERLAVDARSTMAISSSGTLAHVTQPNELLRVFRDGSRRQLGRLPEGAGTPRVSPDGSRLAFSSNGLWVAVLTGLDSTARRLTLDTSDRSPVWNPDGRRLAFAREIREPGTEESTEGFVSWPRAIYSIAVDGRSPADRLALHGDYPAFWSAITGRVAYERFIAGVGWSLWTTAPAEGRSRQVFRSTDRLSAAPSRDGKWLAFEWRRGNSLNFDSSTYIYVSPLRSGGTPTEMPVGDAYSPVWSRASEELFFEKSGRLLVTRLGIRVAGAPTFSQPVTVYDSGITSSGYYGTIQYDVMPDGGSVLVKVAASPEIVVVPDVSSRRIQ